MHRLRRVNAPRYPVVRALRVASWVIREALGMNAAGNLVGMRGNYANHSTQFGITGM
ncbi:MAG: hypothetical protein OJF49_001913 [Ktedonobacterales bacterium]|jgi:hypothetical protein|nr:MAG: hypothetical protein OJF49_001913 [Ktedonobacterales bacterium]